MSGDEDSAGDYAVYYTPFPVHATKADLYIKTTTTRTGITVTLVGNPSVTLHNDVYERIATINLPDIAVDTTATGLQVRTWSYQTPGRAYIGGESYVKVYADD